jgi:two-component system LytT family sensor kinase
VRTLLGTPAVALVDRDEVLAWDGTADEHAHATMEHAAAALASGRSEVVGRDTVSCDRASCRIAYAIAVPLLVDERVVGALVAYSAYASANLVRAANEVGRWVSAQLDLAELDASRTRAMEAEVRALRAQISPHFVYNSLTAIASFVRTDPERARELLLEFADFTRYSFRRHGEFTTLAEELRSIDRYLLLERARFGDRLQVTVQVAPEVLPVTVPFLCVQPLVENAVRHGLEGKPGPGRVTIVALDHGSDALISVEDDGTGIDPEAVRRTLAGEPDGDSVGLGNVDERLRQAYGDEYGLVIETALGAGTKVSMRVPKFHPGVHP